MEIFGVNGYGFRFNEPHNWAHVEVFFCMNQVVTKANVLFFLEPSCNYNNSNVYSVKFDNIQLTAPDNIFTNMEVNDNKLPDYTVFPTVFQNAVTIKINNDSGKLKVVLLDSFGKQVLLENVNLNNDNYELQIPDLASGIYYLVLISNEGKVCKKLFH